MIVGADFVTAGWFVLAWCVAILAVAMVDAIGKIVRATRQEISRRQRGDGINKQRGTNQ